MLKIPRIKIPHLSIRLNLLVVWQMVLLLLLSLAALVYFSRQALINEARSDAEQTLVGTEQHIDNVLMTVEQTTYNVYQDLQWHLDQPDRMFTYCRNIVETYPYIVGCAVAFKPNYYPDHELFLAYVHRSDYEQGTSTLVSATKFGHRPYTEQVWYTQPMSTGRACWTDPLPEEENEGVTISFCLPIMDRHAECVGVIAVDLPVTLLSQIVHANKPSPNSYSVLLSHNGSYIVHHDDDKLEDVKNALDWTEKNAGAGAHEAAEAMLSGATGFKSFQMNDEDWCVFFHRTAYRPFKMECWCGIPQGRCPWQLQQPHLSGVAYCRTLRACLLPALPHAHPSPAAPSPHADPFRSAYCRGPLR